MTAAAEYFDMHGATGYTTMSRRFIDYAKDRGDLPFIRKGKKIVFRRRDLDAFMNADLIDVSADIARMQGGR